MADGVLKLHCPCGGTRVIHFDHVDKRVYGKCQRCGLSKDASSEEQK